MKFRLFFLLAVLATVVVLWKPMHRRWEERIVLGSQTLDESTFQDLMDKSADKGATLAKAWHSGKIPHRQAVVRFLKGSGSQALPAGSDDILIAAARDGDSNVREVGLAALSSSNHPLFLPITAEQLRDPDPNARIFALDLLRNLNTNDSASFFGAALNDKIPLVAATAAVALQKLSGQDFGIRVAQVLDDKLTSESREAFEARRATSKQWWNDHQKHFPSAPLAKLPPPDPAFEVSDFELQDLSGKSIRLSDFRGKVVLLNFWTTWCTACQAEFAILTELQQKHTNELVILGISLDGVPDEHGHSEDHDEHEPKPPAREAIVKEVSRLVASRNLKYRIALDPENKVGARFNGGELPTNVMIDRQGRFSRRFIGSRSLEVFEAILLGPPQDDK